MDTNHGPLPTDPEEMMTDRFMIRGRHVHAPGFTQRGFEAYIKTFKASQLETMPSEIPLTVYVRFPLSQTLHTTTRFACSCPTGGSGMKCYHIAWCIYLVDVLRIDITAHETAGGRIVDLGTVPAQ